MHPNDIDQPTPSTPGGIMTDDKYRIIPRAATVARVTPFEMQVRTLAEYDVNYLQDQIRSDIFINGKPAGVYAAVAVGDEFLGDSDLRHALEALAPNLEKMLIKEFMGLDYRRRVEVLEARVRALQEYKDRPRWFHFNPVRRALTSFRKRVSSARAWLAAKIAP